MSFFEPDIESDDEETMVPLARQYLTGVAHAATSIMTNSFHQMVAAQTAVSLAPDDEETILALRKAAHGHATVSDAHQHLMDQVAAIAAGIPMTEPRKWAE